MASALTALANTTLASTAASVTFSSISGAYRDLILVGTFTSATTGYFGVRVNSDSGANYYWVQFNADGSTAAGSQSTGASSYGLNNRSTTSTTDAMTCVVNILDYTATDKHKNALVRIGRAGGSTEFSMGRWANTAAITSVQVYGVSTANLAAGSTFALYGVSA
jgi:hypothetical protein